MSKRDEKAMRVLDAIYDQDGESIDGEGDLSVVRAGELRERAATLVEQGWVRYLDGLREAMEVRGAVPVQNGLGREVVMARLAALQQRYPNRVVSIGHQRLAKMTDADLRSLLADIEELLASE